MSISLTPTPSDKPHEHLEIHALVDGGYVIREGRFDGGSEGRDSMWNWRQERAAFTTLDQAVKWLAAHMVKKASA